STLSPSTPSALPTAAHTSRTSRSPSGPTMAFALPLFTTIARTFACGTRFSASRTGAARAAFTVKHPAAAHGASLYTSARSLRAALMPQFIPAYENPRGVFTARPESEQKDREDQEGGEMLKSDPSSILPDLLIFLFALFSRREPLELREP